MWCPESDQELASNKQQATQTQSNSRTLATRNSQRLPKNIPNIAPLQENTKEKRLFCLHNVSP